MASYGRSGYEPGSLPAGFGCALIFPAALFGTAMLADFAGPRDWRGPAEFLGWWAVCVAASIWCAVLLARHRGRGRGRYWFLLASIGSAVAFTLLAVAAAHPDTPVHVKLVFTTALQFLGVAAAAGLVAFVAWLGSSSRRR